MTGTSAERLSRGFDLLAEMVGDVIYECLTESLALILSGEPFFEGPVDAGFADVGGVHSGLFSTVAAKPSPRRSNFVPGVAANCSWRRASVMSTSSGSDVSSPSRQASWRPSTSEAL